MPPKRAKAPKPLPGVDAPEVGHIILSANEVWVMMLSTIRYSMGRATYMPVYCRDLYHRLKPTLTLNQRRQIANEISDELALAARQGVTLGHKIDHDTWEQFRDEIDKETGNIRS